MLTHLSCTTAAFLYFVEKLRHALAYKISIMLDSSSVGEVPGAFGGHLLLHNLSILLPHQKHRLFQQCTSNSLKKYSILIPSEIVQYLCENVLTVQPYTTGAVRINIRYLHLSMEILPDIATLMENANLLPDSSIK